MDHIECRLTPFSSPSSPSLRLPLKSRRIFLTKEYIIFFSLILIIFSKNHNPSMTRMLFNSIPSSISYGLNGPSSRHCFRCPHSVLCQKPLLVSSSPKSQWMLLKSMDPITPLHHLFHSTSHPHICVIFSPKKSRKS